jgi:hypothetical protein
VTGSGSATDTHATTINFDYDGGCTPSCK